MWVDVFYYVAVNHRHTNRCGFVNGCNHQVANGQRVKEATPGTSTADAIKQALKENLPELERLLDEIIRRKQRRSFDA